MSAFWLFLKRIKKMKEEAEIHKRALKNKSKYLVVSFAHGAHKKWRLYGVPLLFFSDQITDIIYASKTQHHKAEC